MRKINQTVDKARKSLQRKTRTLQPKAARLAGQYIVEDLSDAASAIPARQQRYSRPQSMVARCARMAEIPETHRGLATAGAKNCRSATRNRRGNGDAAYDRHLRTGTYLRPPMPQFRMSRQDAESVIAYLKVSQIGSKMN